MRQETYVHTSHTGLYVRIEVAFEPQIQRSVNVSSNAFAQLGDHCGADEEYYLMIFRKYIDVTT
jgi:hypothetical protein